MTRNYVKCNAMLTQLYKIKVHVCIKKSISCHPLSFVFDECASLSFSQCELVVMLSFVLLSWLRGVEIYSIYADSTLMLQSA